jgi:predicted O-linked N-acetylglucosamine transferase (SPINDLY family)
MSYSQQNNPENLKSELLAQLSLVKKALIKCHFKEAKRLCLAVLEKEPKSAEGWFLLGRTAYHLREYDVAEELLKKAISLEKENHFFYNALGNVYYAKEKLNEAYQAYQTAIKITPLYAEGYINLSNIFNKCGRLQECIEYLLKALEINPNLLEAYNNLASILNNQGQLNSSLKVYSQSLKLFESNMIGHSNFLMTLLADSSQSGLSLLEAHCKWAVKYARLNSENNPIYSHKKTTQRKLRIGYVSADLKQHSVSNFFQPILAFYDRQKFVVYCYSNSSIEDSVSGQLQKLADFWHNIYGMHDQEVIELIKKDQIDILIDLSGHSSGNRLCVFAQKPAPIQITYLGYPCTTGLSSIDYRITDIWCDPVGYENYHSEKLIRLPSGFLSFHPLYDSPSIKPFCKEKDYITFGCFCTLNKIGPKVITTWAKILKELPSSSLILKNKSFACSFTKSRIIHLFEQEGIEPFRIKLIPSIPFEEHLELYNQVDIGLDPFPYSGTTTTCEAFWMGVPMITLKGNTHVSRVGYSLLHRLGLDNLVATSHEEYIQIAVHLAKDREQLAYLRANIRAKMLNCSLGDGKKFSKQLEKAYLEAWQKWCSEQISIATLPS